MSDSTGIYAIEYVRVPRVYVGATKRGFLLRWVTHRTALNRRKHQSPKLQEDWNQNGQGWFKFVPLEVVPITEPFAPREQHWIDVLQRNGYSCYNIAPAYEMPVHQVKPPLNWAHGVCTVSQVAAVLKVTTATVHRLIDAGRLVGFRVGKDHRIFRDSFLDMMNNRPVQPQSVYTKAALDEFSIKCHR